MNFFFKLFLPLVLIAPGAFCQVAPYPFSDRTSLDPLTLLKKEERFLRKKIRRAPGNGLAEANLANVLALQSQLTGVLSKMDDAEKVAKSSLENLPYYNYSARMVLAEVAEARHGFTDAIKIAEDVLKENRSNISALNLLVSANLGFGKPAEAASYAELLVQAVPDMTSYTFRGLTSLAQGKNQEGIADFNEALKNEGPDEKLASAWLRMLMGRYYFRIRDFENAKAYTDSSLEVMPDYHAALAQKADIESLMGNDDEALKLYQKAYFDREEPPYLLAMANIYEGRKKNRTAEEYRKKAERAVRKEIESTPYGHYNELAQILIDRGNPEEIGEAVAAARTNVAQRMNAESYYILAQALALQGNLNEARSAIDTALATKETNFDFLEFRKALINN